MKSELNLILFVTVCLYIGYGNCLTNNTNLNDRVKRQVSSENLLLLGFDRSYVEEIRYYDNYDFIIAGSGPGGCALANRLTENPNWRVLIIEAGDVETPFQSLPIAAPYLVFTKYNWGYATEPQRNACGGRIGNRCAAPHGKALGGSSVINFLMHTRGNPRDFDRWAEAGNYGWSYKEVLPYFMKSEKANIGKYSSSPFHNKNGLWSVSFNNDRTPYFDAFMEANKIMGMQEIDYNSDHNMGVSYVQSNILNGQRHSAYKAFLEPILNRPNLHILVNTKVTKVLIDPTTKNAYGVRFRRNDRDYNVLAKREVILSSGPFHTPQLLTLSGVGRKESLNQLGIPLIKDLPVGENMHDHILLTDMLFVTNNTLNLITYLNNFFQFFGGRGLLTLPSGVEGFSFIKVPTSKSYGPNVPDIELIFIPGSVHIDRGFGIINGGRMHKQIYNRVYKPLERMGKYVFTIALMMFHPKSTGYIKVPSANPFDDPKIFENLLDDPEDVETMLHGIKYVLKLTKQEPFQRFGTRLHSIPLPQCAHIHFGSDNYWRCVIRTMAISIQHQVGTAKMGPYTDPAAVVSPELKVHGVSRLRVVDTSVVPESPTAHTNAISVMIGEKAADLIKRDWAGH